MTFLTVLVLKRLGLDPEGDVFLNPMGGTGARRLASLESGAAKEVEPVLRQVLTITPGVQEFGKTITKKHLQR